MLHISLANQGRCNTMRTIKLRTLLVFLIHWKFMEKYSPFCSSSAGQPRKNTAYYINMTFCLLCVWINAFSIQIIIRHLLRLLVASGIRYKTLVLTKHYLLNTTQVIRMNLWFSTQGKADVIYTNLLLSLQLLSKTWETGPHCGLSPANFSSKSWFEKCQDFTDCKRTAPIQMQLGHFMMKELLSIWNCRC